MLEFKYHTYQEKKIEEINGSNLYNTIFELSDDALFILDNADLSIVDCNAAATKLFEARSKTQLLGLPSFRLYNYEPSQISSDIFNSEFNLKGESTQELSFRTLHQNIFWGRITRKQIRDGNKRLEVIKISKAANYLKDEEALSILLNGTAKVTGSNFFNVLTKLLSRTFNVKYAFVAKYTSPFDKVELLSIWSYDDSDYSNIEVPRLLMDNVIKGYTSFYPSNARELFPDDNTVKELNIESFLGTPIFDSTGKPIGIIGLMHDNKMHEIPNSRYLLSILASRSAGEFQRIKSKDLLREQARELAYANHMKDRLLSVLSNDLKAPLHTILSYSEIINDRMENYTSKQLSDKFEIMDNSVRSLYSILENITDWSKIQNNELAVKPENVSLHSIISSNYNVLAPLAKLKKLNFTCEVPETCYIHTDMHMVDSILRNLLTIAVKYSSKGGRLEFNYKEKSDVIHLSFTDSCYSVDETEMKQYWETSATIPEFLSSNQNQHALSIFLIREFARRIGCNIQYHRQESGRYTFYFELQKCL